jgi:hypothetical protein
MPLLKKVNNFITILYEKITVVKRISKLKFVGIFILKILCYFKLLASKLVSFRLSTTIYIIWY